MGRMRSESMPSKFKKGDKVVRKNRPNRVYVITARHESSSQPYYQLLSTDGVDSTEMEWESRLQPYKEKEQI